MGQLFDTWLARITKDMTTSKVLSDDDGSSWPYIGIISKARDKMYPGAIVLCVAAYYAAKVCIVSQLNTGT